MKIGYNKIWAVIFFMFDGLICCLAAVAARTDDTFPPAFVGGFWLFGLFGILFLTRTYVEVGPGHVSIKPLLGWGAKNYRVQSARDFSIEGKNVFVMSEGVRQRLPVSSWVVDPGGWASFIKWIEMQNSRPTEPER